MLMRARRLWVCVVAILVVNGCTSEKRQETQAHGGNRGRGPAIPTREMSRELTQDVHASEAELAAEQDSIYRSVGDTVSLLMKRAEDAWKVYRNEECEALRVDFAHGSVAPTAQMECWVELTDDRRRFLGTEYNFVRPPARR